MRKFVAWYVGVLAWLHGCAPPVDLQSAPDAQVKCEAPSAEALNPTARMLPGRFCQACHVKDGQASYRTWTASGTIYDRPDASCNEGGLEGVTVELLDADDKVLITLTTNRSGNFFTAEDLGARSFRARISKDGKVREMYGLQPTGGCAACHYPGGVAPGRIFLQ